MAKGTKQIRMGRVNELKQTLELALKIIEDSNKEYPDNDDMLRFNRGRTSGIKWALELLGEQFPELLEEAKDAGTSAN